MSKKSIDLRGALKVIAAAMRGGSTTPEVEAVDLKVLGKELVANEKLTAKQYELIQGMDEEQQGMVKTLLDAMLSKAAEDAAPEEDPEEMAKQKAAADAAKAAAAQQQSQVQNKDKEKDMDLAKKLDNFMTQMAADVKGLKDEVASIKTNQGKAAVDAIKRQELLDRLVANEALPLDRADLEIMSTDALVKLEAKLRPADYSGQGHFASNRDGKDGKDGGALVINTGYLLKKPEKKKEAV